jgi:FlaA1/EpsC-like NDP-sugar epimerase
MDLLRTEMSSPKPSLKTAWRGASLNRPAMAHSAALAAAQVAQRVRGRHLIALDIVGVALASYVALNLRFDRLLGWESIGLVAPVLALLLAVRMLVDARMGLYQRYWRFASVPDLQRIVLACLAGSAISLVLFYSVGMALDSEWVAGFPRSFWLIELLLSSAWLGGLRFGIRWLSDVPSSSTGSSLTQVRRALLYGAGQSGVLVARSAIREPRIGLRPVGFLDDDETLRGRSVDGLRVFGGLDELDSAVAATGAEILLITMPGAPGSAVRHVVDAGIARGLEVRTVPPINDLIDGSVDARKVRRVKVEDLLRRPIVTAYSKAVRGIICDQTVVITGAGGSIGSELARQVFSLGPRRLVLVDRAESPLYWIQRELEALRSRTHSDVELSMNLANVASRASMDRLIARESPDVIFHAAAYKHVPMMEEHPSDAVHVNVSGTLVLLEAAERAGVPRFVFVSTDKAVRPSSVMGASKRIAEMLVNDAAKRTKRPYVSVRFGNVLGSTGSVLPMFQEQLEKGEPLTITHPDMTRFFMTIPEAAWLILDAAALGTNGDLFVLDMGEPVRIMDLARDLVRLSGRDPDSQPFEIIGLRPGEKLHEELFYKGEEVRQTSSPKVLRAIAAPPPATIREDARDLIASATGATEGALRTAVLEFVRRLDPPFTDSALPPGDPGAVQAEGPAAALAPSRSRRVRDAALVIK